MVIVIFTKKVNIFCKAIDKGIILDYNDYINSTSAGGYNEKHID